MNYSRRFFGDRRFVASFAWAKINVCVLLFQKRCPYHKKSTFFTYMYCRPKSLRLKKPKKPVTSQLKQSCSTLIRSHSFLPTKIWKTDSQVGPPATMSARNTLYFAGPVAAKTHKKLCHKADIMCCRCIALLGLIQGPFLHRSPFPFHRSLFLEVCLSISEPAVILWSPLEFRTAKQSAAFVSYSHARVTPSSAQ